MLGLLGGTRPSQGMLESCNGVTRCPDSRSDSALIRRLPVVKTRSGQVKCWNGRHHLDHAAAVQGTVTLRPGRSSVCQSVCVF